MRNNLTEVEDAVIELGKVQSLINVLTIGITADPQVGDIQNAYYVIVDMFKTGYEMLRKAFYGEGGYDG